MAGQTTGHWTPVLPAGTWCPKVPGLTPGSEYTCHFPFVSDSCMCSSWVHGIKFDFLLSICLPLPGLFNQPKSTRGGKGRFPPPPTTLNSTVPVSACPSAYLHRDRQPPHLYGLYGPRPSQVSQAVYGLLRRHRVRQIEQETSGY